MHPLKLDRDLCFLDIETTGTDVVKDRIVQLALIKYSKDGQTVTERNYWVNPEQPIRPEAQRIHGLSAEFLADKPTFKLLAVEIYDFLADCDLAGYNSNRFDVPILLEEFGRVGLEFSLANRRLIDAMQIFYKMEPRTLRSALRFYCQKELSDAHDALADTRATAEVFIGQIQRYEGGQYYDEQGQLHPSPIVNDMGAIASFLEDKNRVDLLGRFIRNEAGEIIFNFGNNKGEPAHKHPQVLQWMIQRDFPAQVKQVAQAILKGTLR